jgi:2,3-bisphosphoglycerate-dependent phosphoglycerate mutase
MPIYLVRHAETASNAARIVQLPDAALSERGQSQAARLATRLARDGVAGIVSSDLRRAAATAEAVHAATRAPLTYDPGLRERDYGALRGVAYAAIRADIFAPDFEPPDGETWAAFHTRVDESWARVVRLAAATAGNLVVVTHGLVVRAVVERHLELAPGLAVGLARANTSVTVIDGDPPKRVRLLDCAGHLDAGPDGAAV